MTSNPYVFEQLFVTHFYAKSGFKSPVRYTYAVLSFRRAISALIGHKNYSYIESRVVFERCEHAKIALDLVANLKWNATYPYRTHHGHACGCAADVPALSLFRGRLPVRYVPAQAFDLLTQAHHMPSQFLVVLPCSVEHAL